MWPWARKHYETNIARRRAEAGKTAALLNITQLAPPGTEWPTRPARHLRLEMDKAREEIAAAIAQHNIDQIWAPAYEGGNADHDVTNALAASFMPQPGALEFAEYNFAGGKARAQEFPSLHGDEQILKLSLAAQQKKRMALAAYESEQKNLGYVGIARECWRPLAAYDYSRPPHEGKLWYARFRWVPFRHPRVDFTRPRQVSAAITEFFANRK